MADEEQMEQDASTEAEAPEGETTPEARADEPVAESDTDAPEGDEAPGLDAAAEPAAEPTAEEPAAEPEPAADEPTAEAASDESPPAAEATAEAPAAEAETPAVPEKKRKKKRLSRSLRPARSKPKREQPAERRPIVRLEKPEHVRGRRQERQGTVVSSASDKTIVVRVDLVKIHPRYKKVIRRSAKLHAHDETNEAKVGDVVKIVETRPLSRMKRWRLQEIVRAAK